MSTQEYIVTLVHGTWARNASWIQDDSKLCRTLKQNLGPNIKFKRFYWSGKNTHSARSKAVDDLKDQLKSQIEEHPESKHYVISHSHGGNIAFRAAGHASLTDRITGVVCMSTPFLSVSNRDFGTESPLQHLAGLILIPFFLFLFFTDQINLSDNTNGLFRGVLVVGIGILIFALMASLLYSSNKIAGRIKEDLKFPRLSPDKVLIIRSVADEASAVLAVTQLICQLSIRIYLKSYGYYQYIVSFAQKLAPCKKLLCGILFTLFLSIFLILFIYAQILSNIEANYFLKIFIISCIMATIILLVSTFYLLLGWVDHATIVFKFITLIILFPVIFLLSLVLIPFGWEIAFANLLINVNAEPTPPGHWNLHLLEPSLSHSEIYYDQPLMHSLVYEDSKALVLIFDWMKSANK